MEADLGNHEEVQDKYMKETGHKSDATDAQFSSTTKENLDSLPEDEEKNDKNNENVDDGKKNDGKNNGDVVDEKKNDDNENDVDGGKKNDDNEGDVDDEKKNDDKNNEDDVGDETKEIQLNLENEKLKQEISSLKKSIQFYKKNYANNDDCESLQEELESQKRHYEKIIKRKKNDYELKVQELNQKLFDADKELQSYKDYIESFKTEYKIIQEELDANKRDLNDLKTNNIALKEEASKYQSALGVATNFRTSDYKNHSVQLKNDILSLQDSIENYATNLKGKIEINFSNVEKLIQYYGCRTKITKEKPNRSFIKAILQRHVLDTVIEQARNYFNNSGSLESEILYETLHLCSKLNKLSGSRKGVDTITPTSSIKIRQEACVALSNRGFSEIIEKNQTIEHDFIERTKHILNDSMNEYRTIIDPAKKQPVENMATNIVREIIRIFWFRLRAQEPTISSVWINPHVKIDTNTMSGIWEKGEEDIDILFVDLCYFPVIGLNLNDSSKRKLYTRAKVFPIYQEQTYANVTSTLLERGRKIVKNVMPSKEDPAQQVNSNEDVHKQT